MSQPQPQPPPSNASQQSLLSPAIAQATASITQLMGHAIQREVFKYRQHIAELEKQIADLRRQQTFPGSSRPPDLTAELRKLRDVFRILSVQTKEKDAEIASLKQRVSTLEREAEQDKETIRMLEAKLASTANQSTSRSEPVGAEPINVESKTQ